MRFLVKVATYSGTAEIFSGTHERLEIGDRSPGERNDAIAILARTSWTQLPDRNPVRIDVPESGVILQVLSGARFHAVGGAPILSARSQQLAVTDLDGLAPVVDFGDLGDAFFLVTKIPPHRPLPEILAEQEAEEMVLLLESVGEEVSRIIRAGQTQGASWRWFRPEDGADPSTSDPDFFANVYKPEFDDSQWQEDQDSLLGGFGYEDYAGQWMDKVELHRHDSEHGHHLAFSLHNHDCWNHDLRLAGMRLVGWNGPRVEGADLASKQRELAKLFTPTSVGSVLIPAISEWRWLHPVDGTDLATTDPDFHKTFFRGDYDDTAWEKGEDTGGPTGGFGYGDDLPQLVDIGSPLEKSLGKSAYFRHRFTTTEVHAKLELRCQRDDGIIVYLDGREVARDNMTEGEEAYTLPALTTVGQNSETMRQRIPLGGITLLPGEHILAISLHNTARPSSDLRIGGITLVEVEDAEEGD